MNILSEAQFSAISASLSKGRQSSRGTSVRLNKKLQESKTIFLSHSHADKSLIEKAIPFFESVGIEIWVDWYDQDMPAKTNIHTARILKDQIKNNQFFILLATNTAIKSQWCNWELGIGDILKTVSDKIALLPLSGNKGEWIGNEYLQLYPCIKADNNTTYSNEFYVEYPHGQTMTLKQWIYNIGRFTKPAGTL